MSDKNGYIKDEDLHALSKEELVGRLISARDYYRQDQKTIESLSDQCGKAIGDIEKLNAVIEEKDAAIATLNEKLEALCTPIAVACRQVGEAKEMLKPYWKDNNGGQHASAPSE